MTILNRLKRHLVRRVIPNHLINRRVIPKHLINLQNNKSLSSIKVPCVQFLDPDEGGEQGFEICRRLTAAFLRATEGGDRVSLADGIWKYLEIECHQELIQCLLKKDIEGVNRILSRMFIDPVSSGLALGRDSYLKAKEDPYLVGLDWHDKVISLGIALGIIPAQNPEQGEYGTLLNYDSLEILGRVADFLNVDVAPPQIGGIYGVRHRGKVIPVNHILHIYTSYIIKNLSQAESWDCCEVGGGVGFLAYASRLMGVNNFTILDLPLVNVLQGYLLLNSHLRDQVCLYGEDCHNRNIIILPHYEMNRLMNKYHLIINQDSMPEMKKETMYNYLNRLSLISKGYFLSINQESPCTHRDWGPPGLGSRGMQRGEGHDSVLPCALLAETRIRRRAVQN